MLHGYCRDVHIEFGAKHFDKAGFVVDYGQLKEIRRWLEEKFDHTTVLQADDPLVTLFRGLEKEGSVKLTTVPTVSCEGWAMYIAKYVDQEIQRISQGRAWVNSVEVRENGKNSSKYTNRVLDASTNTIVTMDEDITFDDLNELCKDMESSANE
jgi:6-pyruvoyltetrahydropterin/6-carboxytetrahydropterin synthase|tara:strand:+ start:2377 stop:2838 length:462 start_codon:yes stop_codon:yes gene_type:complete